MKRFFIFLLGFVAIVLAAVAAFISVYGLSKLFIGASLVVMILMGTLEFSKIVAVSWLHQYWKKINWFLKSYLLIGIVALMFITSVGIYGFLSSAYSTTSVELEKLHGQTGIIDKKIEIKKEEKSVVYQQVEDKNKRINSLVELRSSQETRLDSLYQKGWYKSAKQTESIIKEANNDIKGLSIEVDSLNSYAQSLNDSISSYEINKLELNSGDLSGEVAPLKYVAAIMGRKIDNIVNYLMLLLIFLIDPLAVSFVLATNTMIKLARVNKQGQPVKPSENSEGKKRKWKPFKKKEEPVVEDNEIREEPSQETSIKPFVVDNYFEVPGHTTPSPHTVDNPFMNITQTESSDFVKEVILKEKKTQDIASVETPVEESIGEPVEIAEKTKETVEEVESIDTLPSYSANVLSRLAIHKTIYLDLLKILYNEGKYGEGDKAPEYSKFTETIKLNTTLVTTEKGISDFFLICNLLNILDMSHSHPKFLKSYSDAKLILGMLKEKK